MNDNLPDIKEYKKYNYKLTPFKLCVLQNFPFIEADFDAITNYQLLCKVVEYLNHVIDNQNTVEDNFKIMADNLNTLYNFLDTLDLQDEVNNKLDAMVEDGSLAEVINQQIFGNINLMLGDTKNPIHYGADPTGTNDSTNAINECIQQNKGETINFTPGKYKITGQIELPYNMLEKVSINGNGATLIADGTFNCVFKCGVNNTDGQYNNVGYVSYINNLFINCENASINYAFDITIGFKDLRLINITTYRTTNGVRIGDNTGSPNDTLIDNCLFYGKGSEFDGIGIISNCTDNYVSNTRIYGFRTGIYVNGYITANNTHVLLRWSQQTAVNFDPIERNTPEFNNVYPLTSFAIVNDNCRIYGCYADSVYKFLDIVKKIDYTILTNSFYLNARGDVDCMIIDIHEDTTNLTCTNNVFNISKNTQGIGINTRKKLGVYSQISLNNNTIQNVLNLTNPFDLIKVNSFKHRNNLFPVANTWYVIGLLSNYGKYESSFINIYLNSYLYSVRINDSNGISTDPIYQFIDSTNNSNYTLGVVTNDDGNKYLCIKLENASSSTFLKFSVDLVNTTQLAFNIFPYLPGQHPVTSSLLLSEFTDKTPERELRLKSTIDN